MTLILLAIGAVLCIALALVGGRRREEHTVNICDIEKVIKVVDSVTDSDYERGRVYTFYKRQLQRAGYDNNTIRRVWVVHYAGLSVEKRRELDELARKRKLGLCVWAGPPARLSRGNVT